MIGIGDSIAFLMMVASLIYGLVSWAGKKPPLYFQIIVVALGCNSLAFLYDVCEIFTTGSLSDGFTISYLGNIGCFLFLLTASYGYMDGILDDRTPLMKKSRAIGLLAPLFALGLLVLNFIAKVPIGTKICYAVLWLPAIFSSYFNLKHSLIPDAGFGFIKAIRPFNFVTLGFTFCQLLHLTLWNFCDWIPLLISGTILGVSALVMMIAAKKGVEKWTI